MESDTFHGDFMVKLIWRLYDNLINHVFFIKDSDKSHNFSTLRRKHIFSSASPTNVPLFRYVIESFSSKCEQF